LFTFFVNYYYISNIW